MTYDLRPGCDGSTIEVWDGDHPVGMIYLDWASGEWTATAGDESAACFSLADAVHAITHDMRPGGGTDAVETRSPPASGDDAPAALDAEASPQRANRS
jgi:hypothetical protein